MNPLNQFRSNRVYISFYTHSTPFTTFNRAKNTPILTWREQLICFYSWVLIKPRICAIDFEKVGSLSLASISTLGGKGRLLQNQSWSKVSIFGRSVFWAISISRFLNFRRSASISTGTFNLMTQSGGGRVFRTSS